MSNSDILNLAALKSATINESPFPYLVVSDFIRPEYKAQLAVDFPKLHKGGSYPIKQVNCQPIMQRLVAALESDELRNLIAEKFAIDLHDRPIMTTLRGYSRKNDGGIHTDSKSKAMTVLLYMNADWQAPTGRLRILRDGKNLNDYAAEVAPTLGTCLIFKVTDNCWHGYVPYHGARRSIQMNYMVDHAALNKHHKLHTFTAFLKRLTGRYAG